MNHVTVETVQRLQPSETTYMEVVRVTPASKPATTAMRTSSKYSLQEQQQPRLYMWILSRQSESSAWANCWMTDAVRPMTSTFYADSK